MPKLSQPTLSSRLANSSVALRKLPKVKTERAKLVQQIWESVPKPNMKFKTEDEQVAYRLGVEDERECQREYDSKLRDAGLR